MSESNRCSMDDRKIAFIALALMVIAFALMAVAFLGPLWVEAIRLQADNITVEKIEESLWFTCSNVSSCISRDERHKATFAAVWLMTFSILGLLIAVAFAVGFWYKLLLPKKFRWSLNTTAGIWGLFSGVLGFGAVMCFVIHRYVTLQSGYLAVNFGWSFTVAVLYLPPVFASSAIYLIGNKRKNHLEYKLQIHARAV